MHRFGVDVVEAFLICNYFYAFILALAICRLLDLCAVPWAGRHHLDVLPLDSRPPRAGRVLRRVLAAPSREFGIAALLYGVVTALRAGDRRWRSAALYVPAFAAFAAVRMWAVSVGPPKEEVYVTVASALANLVGWAVVSWAGWTQPGPS